MTELLKCRLAKPSAPGPGKTLGHQISSILYAGKNKKNQHLFDFTAVSTQYIFRCSEAELRFESCQRKAVICWNKMQTTDSGRARPSPRCPSSIHATRLRDYIGNAVKLTLFDKSTLLIRSGVKSNSVLS